MLLAGAPSLRAAEDGGILRLLSPEQYRHIIADTFGPSIKIAGRFEPEQRIDGLLAVGAARASITAAGFEQYDAMARSVAAQVVDEQHRETLVPCRPRTANAPDDACTAAFLARVGPALYRRPLTPQELAGLVRGAAQVATQLNSFYAGLASSLSNVLVSMPFLFRQDTAANGTLDGYARAARLSFLLWNTAPDQDLLDAAGSGVLATPAGLAREADRLMASPRIEFGLRAFFSDFLRLADFDSLVKDVTITPKYGAQLAAEAREQTLRTVVDLLLRNDGDYRDLFVSGRTFLTPRLASLYRVPLVSKPGVFVLHEYARGDMRAGLLAQASFTALHSHAGRSSPTLRGKALREIVLCQSVPSPPGNVDFVAVQDTASSVHRTARDRLKAHETMAACAGCHRLTDPIGLALENFDSAGGYRARENGAPIDAGGELDGVAFKGPPGLGQVLHDSPDAPQCLVKRLYAYATGRPPRVADEAFLAQLQTDFAAGGYRVPALIRRMVTAEAFYAP